MTTAKKHRPGVTLMEVLVTIFIMGLGMISLLTLFPVGAVSVGRALKDDRAASAAINADGIAWAQDLRNDPLVTSVASFNSGSGVYVDPFGYLVDTNPTKTVGGVPGITRTTMSLRNWTLTPGQRPASTQLGTAPYVGEPNRWCSLLDDIQFKNDGEPDTSSGSVQRYGKYTWAWLLRQQQAGTTLQGIRAWVVVYRDRVTNLPTAPPAGQSETPLTVNNAFGGVDIQTNSVTVNGTNLSLRTGAWVLDVTTYGTITPGYFYRVVDWYVDTTNGVTTIQLENTPQAAATTFVLMDSVVEVFDRGVAPISQ